MYIKLNQNHKFVFRGVIYLRYKTKMQKELINNLNKLANKISTKITHNRC